MLPPEHSPKAYRYDQEKTCHPHDTWTTAYSKLQKLFPEQPYSLNVLQQDNTASVCQFSDGSISSRGKGATPDQARASAVMEYIERYSWATFQPKATVASYNELKQTRRLRFPEQGFTIAYSDKQQELAALIQELPLRWIPACSLHTGEPALYPINWNSRYQKSNGLAAGNTREEAVLQGLCEVIERHNVHFLLSHLGIMPLQVIDHHSIDSLLVKDILRHLDARGIPVCLINATRDLPVPTVIACGIERNPDVLALRVTYGYGCHPNPAIACIRALTEMLQGRACLRQIGINDKVPVTASWQTILAVDIEPLIREADTVALGALPCLSAEDFTTEIEALLAILARRNLEALFIDKTHPALQIPVCRICVPGLLPGTIIDSVSENDDLLVYRLLHDTGDLNRAYTYYVEHFFSIVKKSENVIRMRRPGIDVSSLTPRTCPPPVLLTLVRGNAP